MQIVDDWRRGWRWVSVHCMVLATAVQGTWMWMPDDLRAALPPHLVSGLSFGLLVLGIAGRFIKQETDDKEQDHHDSDHQRP